MSGMSLQHRFTVSHMVSGNPSGLTFTFFIIRYLFALCTQRCSVGPLASHLAVWIFLVPLKETGGTFDTAGTSTEIKQC